MIPPNTPSSHIYNVYKKKTCLSRSIYEKKLFMNECMIMLKYIEYMGRLISTMLVPMVKTPFGKDYGFKCTYITGSTKFPNYNFLYEYIGV